MSSLDLTGLVDAAILQSPHPQPAAIRDPITDVVVSLTDPDAMIDALERLKHIDDQVYLAIQEIRNGLARLTEGQTTAKTRRVQGRRRTAVVEMPGDAWDQAKLKEAWHSFPQHRDQCLKIGSITVALREWHKLANTSGPADLEVFRDMIAAANRGPQGTPTVKIEL